MNSKTLFDKALTFFGMSQKTPGGKRVLNLIRWHQVIPFIVDDKPAFYLDVQRGAVQVHGGAAPKMDPEKEYYDVSRIYTDSETLDSLFEGRKDPHEAQWEDEAIRLLPTGNYAQNTLILQLFYFGRQEILDQRRREFEEGR